MTIRDLTETQLRLIGRLALGLPNNIPLHYQDHTFTKGAWEQGKQLTCDIMVTRFETHAPDSMYWAEKQEWIMTITDNLDVSVQDSLRVYNVYSQYTIQELFKTLDLKPTWEQKLV